MGRIVLGLSLKVLRNTKVERPEKLIHVAEGDDFSAYGVKARILFYGHGMPTRSG